MHLASVLGSSVVLSMEIPAQHQDVAAPTSVGTARHIAAVTRAAL